MDRWIIRALVLLAAPIWVPYIAWLVARDVLAEMKKR